MNPPVLIFGFSDESPFIAELSVSNSLGSQTGLGGQTGCIDRSNRFVQNLQLDFCLHQLSNMKIFLHNRLARCLLSQSNSLSILFPSYISYNKFIKGRNNIEALVKIRI